VRDTSRPDLPLDDVEIALVTYSTKPRGGVVHTLSLAEALLRAGVRVHVVTLGQPGTGFFRPTAVPFTVVPAPPRGETLEERVFASVDALEGGLRAFGDRFALVHTQDCISARAAVRVRDTAGGPPVVRTVHHMDDFTTEALIHCQQQAVLEPDTVLVVSEQWRRILAEDFPVNPQVVHNGVDVERFAAVPEAKRAELRRRVGATDRFLLLAVGGVEPRKGSVHLFDALGLLHERMEQPPVLAVIGGHSFQDYAQYRADALARLDRLGLEVGRDVVLLGTVDDDEMAAWYRSADALAFPSVKEGWGLAVLEAMSADLPVVTSDLEVFHEYLVDGRDVLMTRVGDAPALAAALERVVREPQLRADLSRAGRAVAGRFSWRSSAAEHLDVYRSVLSGTDDTAIRRDAALR
jgi:glycosyltransferase-like protein